MNPFLANVLLVDDREADIALARFALEDVGRLNCNLVVARGGVEALALLLERAGTDAKVDLILLDINMPEMDGFELLEEIRAKESLKQTAVIMCSGSDHSRDRQRAAAGGAVGYIVKPIVLSHLQAILERIPTFRLNCERETSSLLVTRTPSA